MKVITAYPVYLDDKRIAGEKDWLYFDETGKPTNSNETKVFQDWLDYNKPGWHSLWGSLKQNTTKGYGEYPLGTSTESAWNKYGQEFNQIRGVAANIPMGGFLKPGSKQAAAAQAEAKKKGLVWDKAKGAYVKAKELGIVDNILGLFGKPKEQAPTTTTAVDLPQETGAPQKKMSTGVKVALIGGGVLVVGVLIYALTRKK